MRNNGRLSVIHNSRKRPEQGRRQQTMYLGKGLSASSSDCAGLCVHNVWNGRSRKTAYDRGLRARRKVHELQRQSARVSRRRAAPLGCLMAASGIATAAPTASPSFWSIPRKGQRVPRSITRSSANALTRRPPIAKRQDRCPATCPSPILPSDRRRRSRNSARQTPVSLRPQWSRRLHCRVRAQSA